MKRTLFCTLLACGATDTAEAPVGDVPVATCRAGERPTTEGTCVKVGIISVPEGFTADKEWTFSPILPDVPCTGPTIAKLGSKAREPLNDCGSYDKDCLVPRS